MSEFKHYTGCNGRDLDNCSACCLTRPQLIDGKMGINYAAWPLAYMQNNRMIPNNFMGYLCDELTQTDNPEYVANLRKTLSEHGYKVDAIILQGALK